MIANKMNIQLVFGSSFYFSVYMFLSFAIHAPCISDPLAKIADDNVMTDVQWTKMYFKLKLHSVPLHYV